LFCHPADLDDGIRRAYICVVSSSVPTGSMPCRGR